MATMITRLGSSRAVKKRIEELAEELQKTNKEQQTCEDEMNSLVAEDSGILSDFEDEFKEEHQGLPAIFRERTHSLNAVSETPDRLFFSFSGGSAASYGLHDRHTFDNNALDDSPASEEEYRLLFEKLLDESVSIENVDQTYLSTTTSSSKIDPMSIARKEKLLMNFSRPSTFSLWTCWTAVVTSCGSLWYQVWYIPGFWTSSFWQPFSAILTPVLSIYVCYRQHAIQRLYSKWEAESSTKASASLAKLRSLKASNTHYRSRLFAFETWTKRAKTRKRLQAVEALVTTKQQEIVIRILLEALLSGGGEWHAVFLANINKAGAIPGLECRVKREDLVEFLKSNRGHWRATKSQQRDRLVLALIREAKRIPNSTLFVCRKVRHQPKDFKHQISSMSSSQVSSVTSDSSSSSTPERVRRKKMDKEGEKLLDIPRKTNTVRWTRSALATRIEI